MAEANPVLFGKKTSHENDQKISLGGDSNTRYPD